MELFYIAIFFLSLYAVIMCVKHYFGIADKKIVIYAHSIVGTLYLVSFITLTFSLLKITYFLLPAAVMTLMGVWIAYSALIHLRTQLVKPEDRIVTSGIYARIRHPLYFSMLLFAYSAVLATLSLELVVYALSVTFIYAIIIPLEERELLKRFGKEYERYKNKVPAILPRWKSG